MSKCLLSFDVSVAKKLNSLSSTVLLSFFQLKAAKEGNQFKADAIEIRKENFFIEKAASISEEDSY